MSVTVPGGDVSKPQLSVWTFLSLEDICVYTFSAVPVILLQLMSAAETQARLRGTRACRTELSQLCGPWAV